MAVTDHRADSDFVKKYSALLYKILRIRMIEEAIAARYPEGKMRCPTHLSVGQEGIAVMVSENLRLTDFALSTHRAHAHYLAKGGSLQKLIAELHGKIAGCTHGRGGSMNLSDLAAGFVASTAIVGNTIPVGVGLAFSQQLKQSDRITCIFVGDAATEEGVFYESLNFAILRKLPVIFICENNFYSVNTPLNLRQPSSRTLAGMAEAMGAKSKRLDGNDVVKSFSSVTETLEDLRKNGGAWFLELETYRYKVHCGPEDDCGPGRPQEEVDYWVSRDPLRLLQAALREKDPNTDRLISQWRMTLQEEIKVAFDFAENADFPASGDSVLYRYADSQLDGLERALNQPYEEVPVLGE